MLIVRGVEFSRSAGQTLTDAARSEEIGFRYVTSNSNKREDRDAQSRTGPTSVFHRPFAEAPSRSFQRFCKGLFEWKLEIDPVRQFT